MSQTTSFKGTTAADNYFIHYYNDPVRSILIILLSREAWSGTSAYSFALKVTAGREYLELTHNHVITDNSTETDFDKKKT